ncbi:MAG: tetratricopeptide repeat protein [bacterium]
MRYVKYFLLILLTAGFFNNACAADPETLIKKGNEYYQNKQYSDAIEAYEQILNEGYIGASLYYNLGNAYFRAGKLGRAVLNYERALRLEPNDDDIEYNLAIARSRTVDRIKEVPQIFLVEWWVTLVTAFTPSGWAFIVILFYLLLLFYVGFYYLTKKLNLKRWAFIAGSINLGILLLTVIILIASINREKSTDFGILIESIITTKLSPDSKSNDAFVIHEGVKFAIEDRVNEWTRIRLTDGKVGWLPDKSFEKI